MIRFVRRLFIFSLLFYFVSTFYTRWNNSGLYCLRDKLIYSLPWDAFPGDLEQKSRMKIQLGVLSKNQVAELFKKNPNDFEGCYQGSTLTPDNMQAPIKDYFIVRYKNTYHRVIWGDIKCYFSCFPYPLLDHLYGPAKMTEYYNIVLPYPAQEESKPCTISIKWKNMWGF